MYSSSIHTICMIKVWICIFYCVLLLHSMQHFHYFDTKKNICYHHKTIGWTPLSETVKKKLKYKIWNVCLFLTLKKHFFPIFLNLVGSSFNICVIYLKKKDFLIIIFLYILLFCLNIKIMIEDDFGRTRASLSQLFIEWPFILHIQQKNPTAFSNNMTHLALRYLVIPLT